MASEHSALVYKELADLALCQLWVLWIVACDWFLLGRGRVSNRFDEFPLTSQACFCTSHRSVSVIGPIIVIFIVAGAGWLISFFYCYLKSGFCMALALRQSLGHSFGF